MNDNTIEWIALMGLLAVFAVAWNVRWAIEAWTERNRPVQRNDDEIVEAIHDATRELLDALASIEADTTAIRESNAYLEESERDWNVREGHVDEAQWKADDYRSMWVAPRPAGTSIHEAFVRAARGACPDVVIEDDAEPVDLSKRESN